MEYQETYKTSVSSISWNSRLSQLPELVVNQNGFIHSRYQNESWLRQKVSGMMTLIFSSMVKMLIPGPLISIALK